MTTAYRLVQIHFDNLENCESDAIIEKELGIFGDDPDYTAHKKVKDYLATLSPFTPYLGHNREIYPQWRIERKVLR